MSALENVTVIVVTYHSAHCLAALHPLLSLCPHVIISDNASNDGTPNEAENLWPHAKVLAHAENLGFGAANNRALAQVKTPFALLLNPDCEISSEALDALICFATDMPDAALIAPQIFKGSGQLDVNYRWPKTFWKPRTAAAEGPLCVGFVCGAVMLLRISQFEKIGFFDESFFLYHEDDDLCLRLFNAKKPMVLTPNIKALHRSRGSVKGSFPWRSEYIRGYHHAQSKLIFAAKHNSLSLAKHKRRILMLQTTLVLPLRLVLFSPKLLTRMVGRWMGLLNWKKNV